ncbi:MAG: M23 family metallopeptidase [Clostridia bacterium]|nr:M23 family metallopeptidase [Clostridia bacterium]
MEKILSPEERVKRAEEIYYRRRENNQNIRVASSHVNSGQEKREWSLYRKMILQILICVVIYFVFYVVKNNHYIFSQDVVNQTQAFLQTDINFEQVTEQLGNFWNENQQHFQFLNTWFNKQDENKDGAKNEEQQNNTQQNNVEHNNQENTTNNANQNNAIENDTNEQSNNTETSNNTAKMNNQENTQANQAVGMGGASDEKTAVATSADESSQKTQMELDAEYIKKNFSMQLPVKGTITSHYGKRQATEIVSANHQGIDIGVVVGTTVVASMEGKVSVVSGEGEYGTHVKIVNKDVTTIYAHCSKILVKKGETVKKGQKIALSGNTGKTTGPHLHFEIRRNERTVDPELILKWN